MTTPREKLATLAKCATHGPWYAAGHAIDFDHRMMITGADGEPYQDGDEGMVAENASHDDARFIAACDPDTILALLAENESLRARVRELEAMRPSADVLAEIRYALDCTDYRPATTLDWLNRQETR